METFRFQILTILAKLLFLLEPSLNLDGNHPAGYNPERVPLPGLEHQ